ncbi:MAG: signal peptidase I [Chloroflexi bacterium]|nr:signal peptidase I [Chloroflexota bacterium]
MLYQPGSRPAHRRLTWHIIINDWIKPGLTTLLLLVIINLFFPRYMVFGRSMEPLVHEADRLFASHLEVITHSIERGEIVTLSSPADGANVVKRVIGLPGETVTIQSGGVFINGMPLVEDYIEERPRYSGEWTLAADEYFVLGDNRNHSYDSADYGPVSIDRIHGVVKFRFLPLDAFSFFSPPDYPTMGE